MDRSSSESERPNLMAKNERPEDNEDEEEKIFRGRRNKLPSAPENQTCGWKRKIRGW